MVSKPGQARHFSATRGFRYRLVDPLCDDRYRIGAGLQLLGSTRARGRDWNFRSAFPVQSRVDAGFLQNIEGGLVVIAIVLLTLLAVIVAFWKVRKLAALLLLPYLAWVGFATLLNYEFLEANPDGGRSIPSNATQRIQL